MTRRARYTHTHAHAHTHNDGDGDDDDDDDDDDPSIIQHPSSIVRDRTDETTTRRARQPRGVARAP